MREQMAIEALRRARFALSAGHGCLRTDRPDLPITEDTSWTINQKIEIGLIDIELGPNLKGLHIISTNVSIPSVFSISIFSSMRAAMISTLRANCRNRQCLYVLERTAAVNLASRIKDPSYA